MALMTALANNLLIAMPSQMDPNFEKTVIYLCEHHQMGSVGLIINRPMEFMLSLVFEQLKIEGMHGSQKNNPILYGGPLQPERGFVVHKETGGWQSSLTLREDVTVTTSNDIIRAIAKDTGPHNALVTLGYAGWLENQLEKEIKDNVWLVCPYKPELLYEVPFDQRWEYAGMSLGIKMKELSMGFGHA